MLTFPKSQADLTQELCAVLEPLTEGLTTPEKFKQVQAAVQEWADANNVVVYPVEVTPDPSLMTMHQMTDGSVSFDVTFEYAPKT